MKKTSEPLKQEIEKRLQEYRDSEILEIGFAEGYRRGFHDSINRESLPCGFDVDELREIIKKANTEYWTRSTTASAAYRRGQRENLDHPPALPDLIADRVIEHLAITLTPEPVTINWPKQGEEPLLVEQERRIKELERELEVMDQNLAKKNAVIGELEERLMKAKEALTSISKNSCCETCQEAKLFSLKALKEIRGDE